MVLEQEIAFGMVAEVLPVFILAAGDYYAWGEHCSSTLDPNYPDSVYGLEFLSNDSDQVNSDRSDSFAVRPVREE